MERIVNFVGIINKHLYYLRSDLIFKFTSLKGKQKGDICSTLVLIQFGPHPSTEIALLENKYNFLVTISNVLTLCDLSAERSNSFQQPPLWFPRPDIFSRLRSVATTLCSRCFDTCSWRERLRSKHIAHGDISHQVEELGVKHRAARIQSPSAKHCTVFPARATACASSHCCLVSARGAAFACFSFLSSPEHEHGD